MLHSVDILEVDMLPVELQPVRMVHMVRKVPDMGMVPAFLQAGKLDTLLLFGLLSQYRQLS